MKGALPVCLLFITCALLISTACGQVSKNPMPKTYAVVVGISQYQNPAIPRLTYADKDATLFADWLQSKSGGSVPGYRVKLFTNKNATIANIYEALDWLKVQARENDIVYIYFSGHGDIETRDTISQGYLLAWNSPPTNYRNNAISVADINENANSLTTLNNAKVILITDACHSGKMAGDFYKGRQLTAANLRLILNNQVRLASCEEGEEAAEGPGWGGGRGVFSYYLLRGLQGLATPDINGVVKLNSLDSFMKTSFKSDAGLALEKHRQNPVIDGSPVFPLAMVDPPTLHSLNSVSKNGARTNSTPAGLQSLKTLTQQPIDYFFSIAQTAELDTVLHFENYTGIPVADVPFTIVSDYIQFLQILQEQYDSLNVADSFRNSLVDSIYKNTDRKDTTKWKLALQKGDSLNLIREKTIARMSATSEKINNKDVGILQALQKQLQANKYIASRFNDNLVQLTHEKSQEMINAYLNGDLAELEKRQYYYAGTRNYRNFLSVLDVAIRVAPETNYLDGILKLHRAYLTGLVDRLEMATHKNADSLLQAAFNHQRKALQLEPYAAYIHNEMGNLYMQETAYDSAAYYFNYAMVLSPAWAVPWSNKIRLNLALNQLEKAKEAIHIADSLQPNLAYVNVNAGLVMEKDSNWLAAESCYLKAIAQNNVHYLPFQRLGLVYINIGKYGLADSFLLEAKKRKDKFAVNEKIFDFGIELGGFPDGQAENKVTEACSHAAEADVPGWKSFSLLTNALMKLELPTHKVDEGGKLIKKLIVDAPGIPLAHHYVGKIFFRDKQWQLAEDALKKAILRYQPFEDFSHSIKLQMINLFRQTVPNGRSIEQAVVSARTDSSCIRALLIYFHYNVVEDHYMLAHIYEEQGRISEAIDQYKIIAAYENQELMDQAFYKGYKKIVEGDGVFENIEAQIYHYETPVRMGGSIKAARLLEKVARYEEAEAVLLQQVVLNRRAGYARQEEMDKGNFGPAGNTPFNYFWLKANYDLEAETYNFYNRTLALFPRDEDWYRKAGMFLYERLQLTYARIHMAEQKVFYEYSKGYAYPFKGSVEGPTEGYDETGKYFVEKNRFNLPVTGEEINIEMKAYDPLKASLSYLRQALKFSGEVAPGPELVEAMANLDQWMGMPAAAIDGYYTLLQLKPADNRLRNVFIDLLEHNKRLPEARNQLDSLNKEGVLSHEQTIKLAYYKILSKQAVEGLLLLDQYKPLTPEEKNLESAIYIQQLMLSGQLKKALRYCQDSLLTITIPEEEFAGERIPKTVEFDNLYYTEARILAMVKHDIKTLAMIKELLDSGFAYQQVLMNDPALARLRKTKKWKKLLEGYTFSDRNEETEPAPAMTNYNTVIYRIPGSDFNPIE